MSKFLPTEGFNWVNPENWESNKYSSISSKGCVLEVDLEYTKEFCELHTDYPLSPHKIEINK